MFGVSKCDFKPFCKTLRRKTTRVLGGSVTGIDQHSRGSVPFVCFRQPLPLRLSCSSLEEALFHPSVLPTELADLLSDMHRSRFLS